MHQLRLVYGVQVASSAQTSPLQLLQLVADPLRWQLLAELGRSDRRVSELVLRTGKAQSLVSYHLGELRSAGLVTSRRSSADGRDTYYRIDVDRCGDVLSSARAALHPGLRLEPVPAGRARRRQRVLFLCTGNSARSQMAEAFLEHRAGATVQARSAGSAPKPLHPEAVRVMAERGIDISGRRSKHLDRFARSRFDRVITLCDKVREVCPEYPGQPVTAHWSMPDPSAVDGDDAGHPAFVRAAEEIEHRVELLIAQLDDARPDNERSSNHVR
jgi:protein-tyrosine-phosphatase/DNA-binding transcriptional ArsR family regulator